MDKTNLTRNLPQIELAIAIILRHGGVHELRALQTRQGTLSGYYDDHAQLMRDALAIAERAPGTYATVNPVNKSLLARSKQPISTIRQADNEGC